MTAGEAGNGQLRQTVRPAVEFAILPTLLESRRLRELASLRGIGGCGIGCLLRIIDAMAPCVAMIDEVEKAFAGVNGSGDSGVSSRMFGTFLSWLNDHESDVFVACTANDMSRLPPEFGRSERCDGIFFLDLSGRVEKDRIWASLTTVPDTFCGP